ncbi:MAG TPA: hypothetical protein VGI58_05010 [Streptosporangiaceae bacterium]|jgi:hypothetical protein
MPDGVTTQTQTRPQAATRARRLTMNSDGQRHPLLNAIAILTLLAGVAAFALGLIVHLHFVATVLGILAFGVGMCAQMMSATREERIFIMAGVIGGFVGLGLGIAHGGFSI